MSIRSNGSGDNLTVASAWAPGTDLFSISFWIKLISDRNAFIDFITIGNEATNPTAALIIYGNDDGVTPLAGVFAIGSSFSDLVLSAMTVGDWYWITLGRDGSDNLTYRLFDDSTSTTPIATDTEASYTTDFDGGSTDNLTIGEAFTGEWPDAEITNVKIHNGVYWTDSQARTESQNYDIQTAGGAPWGSYRAKNIDADVDGINDATGNGRHLTNTGFINGASDPAQLVGAAVNQSVVGPRQPIMEIF